ncbi:uncharacterized protein LOC134276738 [Saccostrea cucullata]|uniref:uncharacterized protein LOC134276738 n=1 Tax=Saccostrea cuccullata TaxID=36930 RepID=UPI002ED5C474
MMNVEISRFVMFVLLPRIRAVDIEVSTADNRQYVKLSTYCIIAAGRSFYTFKVKAKNDAHFALMSDDDDTRPLYEIVIGGWNNRKSCIRTGKQLPCLSTYSQTVLSQAAYRSFWVTWIGGNIVVGEGDTINVNGIMSYHHSSPYPINFFAVMTGWGASGHWKFNNDVGCTPHDYNNTRIVENYTECCGNMTYECDKGYYLHSGNLQRTCFPNRTWSGDPPYCKRCKCLIDQNLTTPKDLTKRIEQLTKELKVHYNSTNAFHRRKTCAPDKRHSSICLGWLFGYFVIVSMTITLVITDLKRLYRHICFGED